MDNATAVEVVGAIDKEIRELEEERERVIRRHSHFRCDGCDWYCKELGCTESHPSHSADAR